MPNWVYNRITFEGDPNEVEKAAELIIDFDKVIPMPKRLDIVAGGHDNQYVALYTKTLSDEEWFVLKEKLASRPVSFWGNYYKKYAQALTMRVPSDDREYMRKHFRYEYKSINPETLEDVGKAYIDNIIEYGDDTWYEWCSRNWGTKWNASNITIRDSTVEFDTAWDRPKPVIEALSSRFPNLTIRNEWTDEGGWRGVDVYSRGTFISNTKENFEEGDDE